MKRSQKMNREASHSEFTFQRDRTNTAGLQTGCNMHLRLYNNYYCKRNISII